MLGGIDGNRRGCSNIAFLQYQEQRGKGSEFSTTDGRTADSNIECNCDELECNPNDRVARSRKKKEKKDLNDFNISVFLGARSSLIRIFVGDFSFINN